MQLKQKLSRPKVMNPKSQLRIDITSDDLLGQFTDIHDCPIARSLKRMGYQKVRVGVGHAEFWDAGREKKIHFLGMDIANQILTKREPFSFEANIW